VTIEKAKKDLDFAFVKIGILKSYIPK